MSSELTQNVETAAKIRILQLLASKVGIYIDLFSLDGIAEEIAQKIAMSDGRCLSEHIIVPGICLRTNDADLEPGFYIHGYSTEENRIKYVKLDIEQLVNNPNFNFTEVLNKIQSAVLYIINANQTAAHDLQTAMGIVSRDNLINFFGFVDGIVTSYGLPNSLDRDQVNRILRAEQSNDSREIPFISGRSY